MGFPASCLCLFVYKYLAQGDRRLVRNMWRRFEMDDVWGKDDANDASILSPELPELTEHSSFRSPPWSQSHSSVSWVFSQLLILGSQTLEALPPPKKNTGIPLDPSKIPVMMFPHIWKHPRNKWSVWSRWSLGFWNSQFFQFMIWIMLKVHCTYTPFSKNLVSTLVAFEQLFLLLPLPPRFHARQRRTKKQCFCSHHLSRVRRDDRRDFIGKFPRPHKLQEICSALNSAKSAAEAVQLLRRHRGADGVLKTHGKTPMFRWVFWGTIYIYCWGKWITIFDPEKRSDEV